MPNDHLALFDDIAHYEADESRLSTADSVSIPFIVESARVGMESAAASIEESSSQSKRTSQYVSLVTRSEHEYALHIDLMGLGVSSNQLVFAIHRTLASLTDRDTVYIYAYACGNGSAPSSFLLPIVMQNIFTMLFDIEARTVFVMNTYLTSWLAYVPFVCKAWEMTPFATLSFDPLTSDNLSAYDQIIYDYIVHDVFDNAVQNGMLTQDEATLLSNGQPLTLTYELLKTRV